jgi:hypothetical protein
MNPFDRPLTTRFDESDCMLVFKDAKVPWEKVIVHDNPALSRNIYIQPPVISTIVMLRLFARRQRTSMSAYFTNSLTPPARLGLLASPQRGGVMTESLGLTSHKSSCNCTGCGMLRAGVCINCAEKIAALILESGPGELAAEPCSGACREAIELYFSTPPERWRTQ